LERFFLSKSEMIHKVKMNKLLVIGLVIEPQVFFEPEQPLEGFSQRSRRPLIKAIQNKYNGIINEGTTCYINSLLQTLYVIRAFRRAVY